MIFELGKFYQHSAGTKLYICGLAETIAYGRCFIGEDEKGNLSPVGNTEENSINYFEITKEIFLEDNTSIKTGDILYHIINNDTKILQIKVSKIDFNKNGVYIYGIDLENKSPHRFIYTTYGEIKKTSFGKDVFTDQEEAEKHIKKEGK